MSTSHPRGDRCETCRFWESQATECHRHAPVVAPSPKGSNSLVLLGLWPHTAAEGWCGDWVGMNHSQATGETTASHVCDDVATHLFLGRMAPALKTRQPAALLESLLNQLPPDVRRVIVRMNGLDGQPLGGLKELARDFKMSQGQVRALLAAGEQRLTDAVRRLTDQQNEKR